MRPQRSHLKRQPAGAAAVGAELVVRALVGRDLVDAALPLELFKLPVDRGDADVLAPLVQRFDERGGAHGRVRAG